MTETAETDEAGTASGARRNRVVLIRHGATEWSESGQHTGRTDLPLLPRGEDDARRAGRRLEGQHFALVLVSPLQRARHTCELAGYGDQAVVEDDLLEWDYGDAEGRTTAQMREEYPGWTVWDGPIPGGETIEQVATRVDRVIARATAADGDVALFGHGHSLRILTARWCDLDPREGKRFPLGTATYCELRLGARVPHRVDLERAVGPVHGRDDGLHYRRR
ncbi:MAG: histidine phosphatase family protein [Acidimicrobiia bacterium]|nr:histidine phosphatase family protein [Acidimicrobiia bacterium]